MDVSCNEQLASSSLAEYAKTMAASKKRQCFSDVEKKLLLCLVQGRKAKLECKKTDTMSTKAKQTAWADLAQAFNAQTGVAKRDPKQLKKCWVNIKSRAKKEEKQQRFLKTGGGPQSPVTSDESQQGLTMISSQIDPLNNRFDYDHEFHTVSNVGLSCMSPTLQGRPTSTLLRKIQQSTTFRNRKRLTAAQTLLLGMEKKEHALQMEILQLQKDNEIRQRRVLELQETFWKENLQKIISVSEKFQS